MASSKIKNQNVVPMLPVDYEVISNSALKTFPGILSGGGKSIIITIDLPWNISNWWSANSETARITRLQGSLRGFNGYLRSDFTNTDLLSINDLTWTVASAAYALILQGDVTNAIAGATNNTPVMFTGSLTISP